MTTANENLGVSSEDLLAELTDAAYRVILRHGLKGAFIDVQLDLWSAIRKVIEQELFVGDLPGPHLAIDSPLRRDFPLKQVS